MSENLGLGKLITTPQQRDAIHVAVVPMTAAAAFAAGQHFALDAMGRATPSGTPVGIVDPFLLRGPREGEQFWGFLYPNTVSGMRHHWRHPAFPDEHSQPLGQLSEVQRAEQWLRIYAVRVRPYDDDPDVAFTEFMADVSRGEIFYRGTDCHELYDVKDADELFRQLSIYLGRKVGSADFEYSCSC